METKENKSGLILKIALCLLILIGICISIVNQVSAGWLDENNNIYNFHSNGKVGNDKTTEYDFGYVAGDDINMFFGKKSDGKVIEAMLSEKLIGQSVYQNAGNFWEGRETDALPYAFCVGHGNTGNVNVNDAANNATYRIETIWDTDLDPNTPPGTSNIYIAGKENKTVNMTENKEDAIQLAKWAVIAKDTQNKDGIYSGVYPDNNSPYVINYTKGWLIQGYLNRAKQSGNISENYSFLDSGMTPNFLNELEPQYADIDFVKYANR